MNKPTLYLTLCFFLCAFAFSFGYERGVRGTFDKRADPVANVQKLHWETRNLIRENLALGLTLGAAGIDKEKYLAAVDADWDRILKQQIAEARTR